MGRFPKDFIQLTFPSNPRLILPEKETFNSSKSPASARLQRVPTTTPASARLQRMP